MLPVRRCSACGSRYVSPRPSARALVRYYDSPDIAQMGPGYFARMDAAVSKGQYKTLACLPRPEAGRDHLLDIGCAAGHAMLCARLRGWKVTGAEPSRVLASSGRTRYGLDIVHTSYDELTIHFRDRAFDAITAFDLVEHLSDLPDFFRVCRALLRPTGVLLIETPNLPKSATDNQVYATRLRRSLESIFEHLCYLSIDSIRYVAARAGFQIVDWGTSGDLWNQPYVNVSVRRAARELLEEIPGFSRLYWSFKKAKLGIGSPFWKSDERGEHLWVQFHPAVSPSSL
jgi:SAM-dependent methyltransferase